MVALLVCGFTGTVFIIIVGKKKEKEKEEEEGGEMDSVDPNMSLAAFQILNQIDEHKHSDWSIFQLNCNYPGNGLQLPVTFLKLKIIFLDSPPSGSTVKMSFAYVAQLVHSIHQAYTTNEIKEECVKICPAEFV